MRQVGVDRRHDRGALRVGGHVGAVGVPGREHLLELPQPRGGQFHTSQGRGQFIGLGGVVEQHGPGGLLHRDRTLRRRAGQVVVHLLRPVPLGIASKTEVRARILRGHRLVGGGDDAIGRVERRRHILRRVEALPVVAGVPPGPGPAPIRPQVVGVVGHGGLLVGRGLDGPDRVQAGRLVADVAVGGGEEDVLRRVREERGHRGHFGCVGGTVEREPRFSRPARHEGRPLQGHREVSRGPGQLPEILIGGEQARDDGAVHGLANLHLEGLTTGHLECFSAGLVGQARPVTPVGARSRVLLDHQVTRITLEVGEGPGQLGVAADDDARQPCEGEAFDVEGAVLIEGGAVQPHLRPHRGVVDVQVRIVADDGLARRRMAAGDDEGVGADVRPLTQDGRNSVEGSLGLLKHA